MSVLPERPTQELSRTIKATDIGLAEKHFVFNDVSEEELCALAARFDVLELSELVAEITYRRMSKRKVNMRGSFKAKVIQECVVTLNPVTIELEGSFERLFEDGHETKQVREVEIDLDDDGGDDILPIEDGLIDPGETIAEELGLAIPEFPRSEGAEFDEFAIGPEDPEGTLPDGRKNPFAVLEGLKDKMS